MGGATGFRSGSKQLNRNEFEFACDCLRTNAGNITTYFPYGAPCKAVCPLEDGVKILLFGRYIGDVKSSSVYESSDDKIIYSTMIFCTPGGSTFTMGRIHLIFDMSEEDLLELKHYEQLAKDTNEWYHSDSTSSDLKNNVVMPFEDIKPL